MARIVPIGYVTISQGAETIAQSLFGGIPHNPVVAELHQSGFDASDGAAMDDAVSEIWKAADAGKLKVVAIGGRPRKIVKLDPEDLKEISLLRSPRGGDFNLLRPRHRLYKQLTAWFDLDLMDIVIAFREKEIARLARSMVRRRREALKLSGSGKRIGRPGRQAEVAEIVRQVIEARKWTPTESIKALARTVNRQGNWVLPASEDTVSRSLDKLFATTGDRSFQRPTRRRQSPRR
jgi:hypothetical protein